MTEMLYVRLEMTIPQVGTTVHVAELEPINGQMCAMKRIVELDSKDTVTGAAAGKKAIRMAAPPAEVVPHPNSYADYPDINSKPVNSALFESLWAEAATKFPDLES